VDGGTYGSSSYGSAGRGRDTADLGEGLYRPESKDIDTLSHGDGDGKLGLNDVASGAGAAGDDEPVTPAEWPIVIDILGSTKDFEMSGADGYAARDGVITKYERRQMNAEGAGHRPFVVGYFEDWHYSAGQEPVLPGATMTAASGPTSPTLNGRGIDLNEDAMVDSLGNAPTADLTSRPIIEDILGSTEDFEDEGPADMPVTPQERPILEVVLGSTGDYEYSGEHQEPVLPQDRMCMCVCPRNLIAEVMGLSGGAGHCKIMAVRVANPESSAAAGGPLGAIMGGIGGILGGGGGIGRMLGQFASSLGQPGGAYSAQPDGLEPGAYVAEVWSSQGELLTR